VTDGLVIFLYVQLLCGVIIVLLVRTKDQNAYPFLYALFFANGGNTS
jgi:hypothetical protein